jgi:predicted site-specific integrase-resolvase
MVKPAILRTGAEIAAHMGVSRRTVHRYIKSWDLPVTQTPGGVLITSTTLLAQWYTAMRLYKKENGLHAFQGFPNI